MSYISRLLVLPLAAIVFAAFTLKTQTMPSVLASGKSITVVLDAGHGGNDAGAHAYDGTLEKELSLQLVKKIQALNTDANVNIILTRSEDVYHSPKEKAEFAKKMGADLFISIHVDNGPKKEQTEKSGISVWIARDHFENAPESRLFASALIGSFKNGYGLPVDAQPRQSKTGIWVLQSLAVPSVIVESGYINNKNDLAYLKSTAGQELFAKKILEGIYTYASTNTIVKATAVADTIPTYKKYMSENVVAVNLSTGKSGKDSVVKLTLEKGNTVTMSPGEAKKLGFLIPAEEQVAGTTSLTYLKLSSSDLLSANNVLILADGKELDNSQLKNHTISAKFAKIYDKESTTAFVKKYGAKAANGVMVLDQVTIVRNDYEKPVYNLKADSIQFINASQYAKENYQPSPTLKIKGILNPQNTPLYVIDGVVATDYELKSLNPETIETVNVLKDQRAIAKYGIDAKDGVIVVTTKKSAADLTRKGATKQNGTSAIKPDTLTWITDLTKKQSDAKIFTAVEEKAQFPGGEAAWQRYLQIKINPNMPVEEKWTPGTYKIVVAFVVHTDGSISDIKVENYAGTKTAQMCIDLIAKGPKWIPAKQQGKTVVSYRKQPITFVITN